MKIFRKGLSIIYILESYSVYLTYHRKYHSI